MRKSFYWVLMHTLLIFIVIINLLTGARIASVHRPEVMLWSAFLPQGQLHSLHLGFGAGLFILLIMYGCYMRYGRHRLESVNINKQQSLYHKCVTQLGYVCLSVMLISGGLLYLNVFSSAFLLDIHYLAALGLVIYIPLHAGIYYVQHGLKLFPATFLASKQNRNINMKWIAVSFMLGSALFFLFAKSTPHTLYIHPVDISRYIKIDGYDDEPIWQSVQPYTVHTYGGANFDNGETKVEVKAVQNGVDAFFHLRWYDPTHSINHLPLKKTSSGWQVQEDGYYQFDEQTYYEDKFAVIVSENCDFAAAGTAHLGPKPLVDKPKNWHGKGYHYTANSEHDNGNIVDLWHWKAVRTNNMVLMDDNYIAEPAPVRAGSRRYTAGYQKDAKLSGSYVMNWHWYKQGGIIPKRLPQDINGEDIIETQLPTDKLFPVLAWDDTQPYQQELDLLPLGASLPSVLYRSNRFEGDRANIRAFATWQNGAWSLEIARKLDTNSQFDVPLKNGVCMWFAAFDHSQIAHTRHTRPVQLKFK